MELTQKQINSIEISITYQNEIDEVDFNRADWEINLEINFHSKPLPKKRKVYLNKAILSKYDNYRKHILHTQKRQKEISDLKKHSKK